MDIDAASHHRSYLSATCTHKARHPERNEVKSRPAFSCALCHAPRKPQDGFYEAFPLGTRKAGPSASLRMTNFV
ncbi:hypothetical protein, partial [Terriglobus sp. ADX1]|uniref:hypothetical protein n=1 Tax=Terriglobus sp. ADX1 TaxID=2794063 RepID=UPI002FE550F9